MQIKGLKCATFGTYHSFIYRALHMIWNISNVNISLKSGLTDIIKHKDHVLPPNQKHKQFI